MDEEEEIGEIDLGFGSGTYNIPPIHCPITFSHWCSQEDVLSDCEEGVLPKVLVSINNN
jgi:hypothetical protein